MEIFNSYFHQNVKSPAVSQKHSLSFKASICPESDGYEHIKSKYVVQCGRISTLKDYNL